MCYNKPDKGEITMNIDTVKLIIKKPSSLFVMLGDRGLLNWIPDNIYIYIYSS